MCVTSQIYTHVLHFMIIRNQISTQLFITDPKEIDLALQYTYLDILFDEYQKVEPFDDLLSKSLSLIAI